MLCCRVSAFVLRSFPLSAVRRRLVCLLCFQVVGFRVGDAWGLGFRASGLGFWVLRFWV